MLKCLLKVKLENFEGSKCNFTFILIYNIENFKRECEAKKDFGESFIKLSRDVHFKNDIRAKIKKEINLLSNSEIVEEKEYSKY